jgi:hypothetical protein
VGVHSLKLFYTLENMKCDLWASLLAHTFASPCFDGEAKVKVATKSQYLKSFIINISS